MQQLSHGFLFSAIDLLYGGIYCFMCQDYIYDKDMEQIAKEEQRKAWKLQGMTFLNRHSSTTHWQSFMSVTPSIAPLCPGVKKTFPS